MRFGFCQELIVTVLRKRGVRRPRPSIRMSAHNKIQYLRGPCAMRHAPVNCRQIDNDSPTNDSPVILS